MRQVVSRALVIGAALASVIVVFIAQSPFAQASAGLKKIHDPRRVTYSIRLKSCHARDGGKLPDPACTPGSIDPAVTQKDIRPTICKSGWTATVRPPESQTEYAKYHVAYPAYHIKHSAVSELDHLVPLELGGSNDITNLWPEVGKQPNAKDKVEDALNRAVCEGKVSLAAAQNAIASDWITAEAKLGLTHPRPGAPRAPPTTRPTTTTTSTCTRTSRTRRRRPRRATERPIATPRTVPVTRTSTCTPARVTRSR